MKTSEEEHESKTQLHDLGVNTTHAQDQLATGKPELPTTDSINEVANVTRDMARLSS